MAEDPLDLFPEDEKRRRTPRAPLAERMRPRTFEEFVGQEDLLKSGSLLRSAVRRGEVPSLIFWGPPGPGKTRLAGLIGQASGSHFVAFSAVTSGVKEVREVIERARLERKARGIPTLLFIDEIHRFNKAQQDAFLPHVEDGTIVLMGATTENPSFEVNNALLSRMQVIVLPMLGDDALVKILRHAADDPERGLGGNPPVDDELLGLIARLSNGDARIALNILEGAARIAKGRAVTDVDVREAAQRKMLPYDRAGEEHFNIISALHKALRRSDPDAGLYWLAPVLEAGGGPPHGAPRPIPFPARE